MSSYNYKFPDGGIYCGELNAKQLPEGKGICKWPDGSKYDGYWADGKKHGTGLMISAQETIKGFWYEDDLIRVFSKEPSQGHMSYVGEKNSKNKPHGKGKYTYADGSTYDGYWVDGVRHGTGTQCDENGNVVRGFWWDGELLHVFGVEEPVEFGAHLPKNKNKIVALLVGCSNYKKTSSLESCVNEVTEIGTKLSQIGADVTILKDATVNEIKEGLCKLREKEKYYDHAIFYFSGHGAVYGGYHLLQDINGNSMGLETGVISHFYDSDFKNIIIVHDACNKIIPIEDDSIEELHDAEQMIFDNKMHTRNVLYAFSSLNGNPSFASRDSSLGMFALAFIENIQKRNIPVIKMFDNITKFVVNYSQKTYGEILEVPYISKTLFDDEFCLYSPEE